MYNGFACMWTHTPYLLNQHIITGPAWQEKQHILTKRSVSLSGSCSERHAKYCFSRQDTPPQLLKKQYMSSIWERQGISEVRGATLDRGYQRLGELLLLTSPP